MNENAILCLKGGVAWQILANAIYDFFWTTARKWMDLINGQRALAFAKQTKVLHMLHAHECCGRAVRSRIIPYWP